MGAMESFLNILFIYLIVSSLFRIFTLSKAKKKAQKLEAKKLEMEERQKAAVVVEMVTDNICGSTVPKSQAYILVKDDKRHYFCSWDCREKFTAGESV